jgi:thymidylate synthase ThyX
LLGEKNTSKLFTNWDRPVFAIFNLPQEVVGAMFSRYSRSAKSVRRLFLDEFWNEKGLGFQVIRNSLDRLDKARERTKSFYERVFAEYGDDSVIQMGSVHVAYEYVSQILGAKAIEDQRVASAYIEKSTRYVDFSTKL